MKENRKKKTWLVVLLLILFIIFGIAGFAWKFYNDKISLLDRGETVTQEEIEEFDPGDVVDPDEEFLKSIGATLSDGDILSDGEVLNILLMGTDERTKNLNENARADCIMLFSLNKKTMAVKLISFERGMGVPILDGAYSGQYDWITHTFRYGGAELTMKEVRECFKVDVNHYVRVNFDIFEQIIDKIGGVDIEITAEEAAAFNNETRTNAIMKHRAVRGINHLDGYDALQYCRQRYVDNDWYRIKRQRTLIKNVIEQTKTLKPAEINNLLNETLPLVQTNITNDEITKMLPLLLRYADITVDQMTIPQEGTFGSMVGMGGRRMFAPDFDTNAKIIQEFIY